MGTGALESSHNNGSLASRKRTEEKRAPLHDTTLNLKKSVRGPLLENVCSGREIPITNDMNKCTGHAGGFHYPVQPLVSNTSKGCSKVEKKKTS